MRVEIKVKGGRFPSPGQIAFSQMAELIDSQLVMEDYDRSLKITLNDYQQRVHDLCFTKYEDNPSIVFFRSALGTGKTEMNAEIALESVIKYPGMELLLFRKSYKELEETLKPRFLDKVNECGIPYTENKKYDWVEFPNKSKVWFRSSQEPEKLGSLQISAAIGDEVNEVEEAFFDALLRRIGRQDTDFYPWFLLLAANPPPKSHWLYKKFVSSHPGDHYQQITATLDENEFTTKAYKNFIRNEYINSPALYKRFVLGEWGSEIIGDPVFLKIWNRNVHLAKEPLIPRTALPIIRSWDFGYHHPTILYLQKSERSRLFVFKEIMYENKVCEKFIDAVEHDSAIFFPGAKFIDCCDAQCVNKTDLSEKTRLDIMRSRRIYPKYQRGSFDYRIGLVSRIMSRMVEGQPALLVDPIGCPTLVEGMEEGYLWARDPKNEKEKKAPAVDDLYEHTQDCLQFAMMNMMETSTYTGYPAEGRASMKRVDPFSDDEEEEDVPYYSFGGRR